jgi:hypothetical protein
MTNTTVTQMLPNTMKVDAWRSNMNTSIFLEWPVWKGVILTVIIVSWAHSWIVTIHDMLILMREILNHKLLDRLVTEFKTIPNSVLKIYSALFNVLHVPIKDYGGSS